MATNPDLAEALRAVQQVIGAPAFTDLVASGQQGLQEHVGDPAGALRARGVTLPEAIKRVTWRARHTPPAARQRGLRGGTGEWRFYVQVGAGSWRVIYLCDAWPLDEAEEAPAQT